MTRYELVKALSSACEIMAKNGVMPSEYKYVQMYEDYMRMKAEGHKITFIFYWLHEQYGCSERTVMRVVKKLGKKL